MRTMETSMGRLPHLGECEYGRERLQVVSSCYGNGQLALMLAQASGQVYTKLTVNLDPFPASPWSVLVPAHNDAQAQAALLHPSFPLRCLDTGRQHESGFVQLPELVVLPPAWTEDAVGDLHALQGGWRADVEVVDGCWLGFVDGRAVEALAARGTSRAEAAVALLEHLRERGAPEDLLGYPWPPGAPRPQVRRPRGSR